MRHMQLHAIMIILNALHLTLATVYFIKQLHDFVL